MIRALLLLLALHVSACSMLPEKPQVDFDVDANQARLLQQQQWQAKGRILIRQETESWHANLEWRHLSDYDRLIFSTALGGVVFVLESSDELVSVTDDSGVTEIGAQSEVLSKYGFVAPMESLGFWVRGMPNPDKPYRSLSREGALLTEFQQDGWQIQYDRYDRIDEFWLPHRVTLTHADLLLKYVVDAWY